MLDKMIHEHIDDMDELENQLKEDVEKILSKMVGMIDQLLDDPRVSLESIADEVYEIMKEDYSIKALGLGSEFAKRIERKIRPIVLQDGNDPSVNKEKVDIGV